MLFSLQWWKDSAVRAARTALLLVIPFFPAAAQVGGTEWQPLVLTAAFGFIASMVTSVALLPDETTGVNLSKGKAILYRVIKSFFQGLASGFGTAALLTDVDWNAAIQVAIAGAIGSFILGMVAALPETAEVVTQAPADGEVTDVPEGTPAVVVVPEGSVVYSDHSDGEGDLDGAAGGGGSAPSA